MILIKNCSYIVTQNKEQDILENADVFIEGSMIKSVGIFDQENVQVDITIDGSDKILMPGLINMHTHVGMTHLRGISDDEDFHAWLTRIWAEEKKLTGQMVYESTAKAAREMISTGTTCFSDMYFYCEKEADAAAHAGIRAYIGYGMADMENPEKAKLEIAKAGSFREYVGQKKYATVSSIITPHAPYTVSTNLLLLSKKMADEQNTLLEIHILETEKEKKDMEQKYEMGIVAYLDTIKFWGKNVISVHNVWMDEKDLDIILKNKVTLCHCPTSNLKLATGCIMPVAAALRKGINVVLGTDSTASNNSLNLFSEMKMCALLQKHKYRDATAITAQQVLDMATINGANALGINAGSIEEGKLADIILLNISENLKPIDSKKVVSNLIYSATGSEVNDVIINGKIILSDRKFLH